MDGTEHAKTAWNELESGVVKGFQPPLVTIGASIDFTLADLPFRGIRHLRPASPCDHADKGSRTDVGNIVDLQT
jgi:hypothetical protein